MKAPSNILLAILIVIALAAMVLLLVLMATDAQEQQEIPLETHSLVPPDEPPAEFCSGVAKDLCEDSWSWSNDREADCRERTWKSCMIPFNDGRQCRSECMEIVSRLEEQYHDYYERWLACIEGEPQ